jgi:hypothetical protein
MAINTTYTQSNASQKQDTPALAAGRITFGADSITAADYVVQNLGFTPRYIKVENVTDRISVEWYEGMAADTCVKTAANGAKTLETTNLGLTVCDSDGTARTTGRSFKIAQNATLAVIAASKVLSWVAFG